MTKGKKHSDEQIPCEPRGSENTHDYRIEDYVVANEDQIKVHHESLRSREDDENDRLTLIETKTSQMVSQTGLIFALLGLFIPTFIDKVSDQTFGLRIAFFLLLFLAFLFYILTIQFAARNFNVKNFIYSRPNPTNVIKYQNKTASEFLAIEIKDLFISAERNTQTNNRKASNLVFSSKCFRIATLFTALLGLFLCFLLLFSTPKKNSVTIENPVKIENVEPRSINK